MVEKNAHRDSFERSMQELFGAAEEIADSRVWDNIADGLAEERDRLLGWWWWSGAAVSIVLALFVFGSSEDRLSYMPRVNNYTYPHISNIDTCTEDDFQIESAPQTAIAIEEAERFNHATIKKHDDSSNSQNDLPVADFVNMPQEVESAEELEGEHRPFAHANLIPTRKLIRDYLIIDKLENRADGVLKVHDDQDVDWQEWDNTRSSQWAVAANFGSSSANEGTNSGVFALTEDQTINQLGTGSMNQNAPVIDRTYHSPISFGLRANITLTKRLSLESGLTYSLLPSTSQYWWNGDEYVERNNDHFIGTPLILRLSVINKKRFGLYSAQGIIIDKGIASRSLQAINSNGTKASETIIKSRAQGLQSGLSVGIGAEYRFAKQWALYIEPSITHWFLNANVSENIRNQQVVWPSVQIGARYIIN